MSAGAFGALFSTKQLEDGGYPSSSGGDAAAGGSAASNTKDATKAKLPVYVPPRPRPPARIPAKTRGAGLRSDCGSSVASSPPGTPSSCAAWTLGSQGNYISPKLGLSSSASAKLEQVQNSPSASPDPSASCFAWWGGVSPAASHATKPSKAASESKPVVIRTVPERKASNTLELSDMCCFRGERGQLRRPCDPIHEDRPETVFDRDMNMLDLQSLLRHHNIEPNDGLIYDILQWQKRARGRDSFHGEMWPANGSLEEPLVGRSQPSG